MYIAESQGNEGLKIFLIIPNQIVAKKKKKLNYLVKYPTRSLSYCVYELKRDGICLKCLLQWHPKTMLVSGGSKNSKTKIPTCVQINLMI